MILQSKDARKSLSITLYKGNIFIFIYEENIKKTYIKLYPDDTVKMLAIINAVMNKPDKEVKNIKIKENFHMSKIGSDIHFGINDTIVILDKYKLKAIQLYLDSYINNIPLLEVISNIKEENLAKNGKIINKKSKKDVEDDISDLISDGLIADVEDDNLSTTDDDVSDIFQSL